MTTKTNGFGFVVRITAKRRLGFWFGSRCKKLKLKRRLK
jgi:hypothetical protein